MQQDNTEAGVLIIAPVGQDAGSMAEFLNERGFVTQICAGPGECARCIDEHAGVLLLTEEAFELPNLSLLLETLQAQPPWSELPLILLTSGGESRFAILMDTLASAAGTIT